MKDVLIFIHGMLVDRDEAPRPWLIRATPWGVTYPGQFFEELWKGVLEVEPALADRFPDPVFVRWGRVAPEEERPPSRRDERITPAQERVLDILGKPAANDRRLGLLGDIPLAAPLRMLIDWPLRPMIVVRGFGDVVYYCGTDGEAAILDAVYAQIFGALEKLGPRARLRLHVVAHSLGVTIANDMLHGLFAPHGARSQQEAPSLPRYLQNPKRDPKVSALYQRWRENADRLEVGSIVSMASQLPLLLLRSQRVIDLFADGEKTLPTDEIGISSATAEVVWKVLYDVDDLLAFPTHGLFGDTPAIQDIQVSVGDDPWLAHMGYCRSREVHREIAELLFRRSGDATREGVTSR